MAGEETLVGVIAFFGACIGIMAATAAAWPGFRDRQLVDTQTGDIYKLDEHGEAKLHKEARKPIPTPPDIT